MDIAAILTAVDEQINKLQQARAMLSGTASSPAKKSVGRPKGSTKGAPVKASSKRILSPEARKKIADAQKKRWAAAKKLTK